MAKRFAEHSGLDLTKTNKEVLAEWKKRDIFHKSIEEREGCPYSLKGHLRLTVIRAFTMYLREVLKIRSTGIRP